MYADDTTLYFKVEDFPKDDLRNCVTNELNKIHSWLQNNKLSLSSEKTKCITFHTRQKHINPILYSINRVEIENVDSFTISRHFHKQSFNMEYTYWHGCK